MYNSYQNPVNFKYPMNSPRPNIPNNFNNNDSRFVGGGFLGPFLLGGITGGLVSPLFYGGYNRPYYNNYYYPPYYGPYYR